MAYLASYLYKNARTKKNFGMLIACSSEGLWGLVFLLLPVEIPIIIRHLVFCFSFFCYTIYCLYTFSPAPSLLVTQIRGHIAGITPPPPSRLRRMPFAGMNCCVPPPTRVQPFVGINRCLLFVVGVGFSPGRRKLPHSGPLGAVATARKVRRKLVPA